MTVPLRWKPNIVAALGEVEGTRCGNQPDLASSPTWVLTTWVTLGKWLPLPRWCYAPYSMCDCGPSGTMMGNDDKVIKCLAQGGCWANSHFFSNCAGSQTIICWELMVVALAVDEDSSHPHDVSVWWEDRQEGGDEVWSPLWRKNIETILRCEHLWHVTETCARGHSLRAVVSIW